MTTSYQDQINALADRVAALEARGTNPGPNSKMLRPREPEPGDEGLFQAIASWRYDRAKVDGVASYRIFGNQVLAAITTAKPVDRYELLQIHGLGEQKVDLYGNDIIAIVRDHIDGEW